ncbi:MAG: hypothetical protein R3C05_18765 [Pirellulaceae bacterium]
MSRERVSIARGRPVGQRKSQRLHREGRQAGSVLKRHPEDRKLVIRVPRPEPRDIGSVQFQWLLAMDRWD